MGNGRWKPISETPKKDGKYMVKFYFADRHVTDNIAGGYRTFRDGVWFRPYYSYQGDGSELYEWFDTEG